MTRTALITGGSSGMGRATAAMFAENGYRVVVASPNRAGNDAARDALSGSGHLSIAVDVSDEASVAAGFDEAERDGPVDVIANFAGILGSFGANRPSLDRMSVEEWERIFAVNARGSFLCVREMLRRRKEKPVEHGRIILVGSSAAQTGTRVGSAAYGSSKGAVFGLVKTAALEAAPHNITVNSISPGSIDTPMLGQGMTDEVRAKFAQAIPLARIGTPAEVAAAALFLASPGASYVTGTCLDVNGGLRMH